VTNLGRMIRLPVLDMPALPPTSSAPSLSGGAPLAEFVELGKGEHVVTLSSLRPDSVGIALLVVLNTLNDAQKRKLEKLRQQLEEANKQIENLIRRQAGAARDERHPVGDDERRVEPDAELADEGGVLALIAALARRQRRGPTFRPAELAAALGVATWTIAESASSLLR